MHQYPRDFHSHSDQSSFANGLLDNPAIALLPLLYPKPYYTNPIRVASVRDDPTKQNEPHATNAFPNETYHTSCSSSGPFPAAAWTHCIVFLLDIATVQHAVQVLLHVDQ